MIAKLCIALDWIASTDQSRVMAIDAKSDFPWPERAWELWRWDDTYCMVARAYDGEVVGFCVYTFGKRLIHVEKVLVDEPFRRMGVGRAMLDCLASYLGESRHAALLSVSEWNLDAHRWLRACGWRATETLRGIDPETEAAYLFERRLVAADVVRTEIDAVLRESNGRK